MTSLLTGIIYFYFAFTISLFDIKFKLIKNRKLLQFFGISVVTFLALNREVNLRAALFAIGIAALSNSIFQHRIGVGDLKLLIVLAFWSSDIREWLQCFAISWILGGVVGLLHILRKSPRAKRIAFAPFIFIAFLPVFS
jgi:prepilin signal peptidase PulO-like enzyme (type II secretory pathway)